MTRSRTISIAAIGPLLLLLLAVAACSSSSADDPASSEVVTTLPDAVPSDFEVEYRWGNGPLPPPHHYEYRIRVGPGASAEIAFSPDYPSESTPRWVEPAPITDAELEQLYTLMLDHDVFARDWVEAADFPDGTGSDSMTVRAAGVLVQVPGFLEDADDEAAATAVYGAVRALVPTATWDDLQSRQRDYEAEHAE